MKDERKRKIRKIWMTVVTIRRKRIEKPDTDISRKKDKENKNKRKQKTDSMITTRLTGK